MSEHTIQPPQPVADDELTPALRRLDRVMTRFIAIKTALDKTAIRDAQVLLAGAPCHGEFDVNYRVYLRNALNSGATDREIERLEHGMDHAFTELAVGGNCEAALACLSRHRDASIPVLTRPALKERDAVPSVRMAP